ncbi:MAG: hypothetical protein E7D44_15440, partial [Eggerthella sp.]|nr:hypothetical protein [Eggerthella sp.]
VGFFVALLFGNRRVGDIVQLEVFLNLLDFGGCTALLGVQTAGAARTAGVRGVVGVEIVVIGVGIAGRGVTGSVTVGGGAAAVVAIVAATAARLGIVIVVAARAAGATRRTFVVVNIVITSVSGIVRIHSGGQYRFLEEQGRHRLAATHGLVARGQGFDRVEQALIRGVLVRIRNCTARTTANRTVLVIIIHIHRRTARAGANRPILVVIIVGLAGARAAANRAVLVVIVIVYNRTAAGTWGVIVIEIIGTDSAARTMRTIILAIRVGHCGSGAARTAAGWTFGGILGIAGFIGIAGIG